MALTSANLVGYLRAEFAKASELRGWLFLLQLIAAVPTAIAVLIPDHYSECTLLVGTRECSAANRLVVCEWLVHKNTKCSPGRECNVTDLGAPSSPVPSAYRFAAAGLDRAPKSVTKSYQDRYTPSKYPLTAPQIAARPGRLAHLPLMECRRFGHQPRYLHPAPREWRERIPRMAR
jgi:hypothetical protein